MINPICNWCQKEIYVFGAIVISPPQSVMVPDSILVIKYHCCLECFDKIKPKESIDK